MPAGYPFGGGNTGMAADPQEKFFYVSNGGDIDVLAINSMTGALTFISGSPAPGPGPYITIDPSGSFLYADSELGIAAFSLDANTGALTEVAGSPFPIPEGAYAGNSPAALVVDSTSSFLYVVVYVPQEGGASYSYVVG